MTSIVFHPKAEAELRAAVHYYNDCQAGLGLDFAGEVHRSLQHILAFPNAWTRLSRNTQRYLINRFPYGIIYSATKRDILIVAVMHLNRKPRSWTRRTPGRSANSS
jgi:plasmid stabilization system protein ParE